MGTTLGEMCSGRGMLTSKRSATRYGCAPRQLSGRNLVTLMKRARFRTSRFMYFPLRMPLR